MVQHKVNLGWIDFAKGVGIVLVVYGHVVRGLIESGLANKTELLNLIDSLIYSFHMPIFFFVSGFLFIKSFSGKSAISFFEGKLNTIIYPYIVWSIVQLALKLVVAGDVNEPVLLSEFTFLLYDPVGQFWFLQTLFLCFSISYFLYEYKKEGGLLVLLVASLAMYFGVGDTVPVWIRNLSHNLSFFVFGSLFFEVAYRCSKIKRKYLYLCAVFFVLLQVGFHGLLDLHYTDRGVLTIVLGMLGVAFVSSMSSITHRRLHNIFAHLGRASMVIFLLHIIFGSGARVLLLKFLEVDDFYIHLVFGMIAGVVLPYTVYEIQNKLGLKWIFVGRFSMSTSRN